ncbi:hypothetical protein FDECE_8672 [Fusarium decemcellulare]|nr:hypothetical protein FDECE_8672 [Fusarium decemcellulare]
MSYSHSTSDEAPPKYEELDSRPTAPPSSYLGYVQPPNEFYLSPEQRCDNLAWRDWIRNEGGTVAAAPCSLSCSELSGAVLISRVSKSTTQPRYRRWLARLRQGRRSHNGERSREHVDASPGPQLAMGGRPLQIGEHEMSFNPEQDWTAKWGWVLRLRAYTHPEDVPCSHWCLNVDIFFQDLPLLLSTGGLKWSSAYVEQSGFRHHNDTVSDRAWPWVQFSTYKPNILGTRWRAEAVHRSRHRPLRRSDLMRLLCAETVYQAEIDQRTAAGRAKRVMIYYPQVGYGNDITGQRLDAWHDGLPERFGQFIRPLMPFDPYYAEEGTALV